MTCLLGTVAFNGVNVVRHVANGDILTYFAPLCNGQNLVGFLYLSILSTIGATAMYNFALSRIQVSSAAAFGGVSTLVTVAAGVLLNGETLFYYHYIGISLILLRIAGVTWLDTRKTSASAAPLCAKGLSAEQSDK